MGRRMLRGLQDLRTVSGSIDDRSVPFRAYMKLSVLEMEKFRRGKERLSALAKVRNIDERFEDIEAEKREILASMEVHSGQPGRPHELAQQTAPPPAAAGSFKFKY